MLKKVAENASLDIIDNNNKGNTWSNVPRLMIQGDYCNLVKDEEGNYRLYINKNNNHPKFNSIDDFSGSTYGTYYPCADEGLYLPTGHVLGNTFTKCVSLDNKNVILNLDNEDPENRSLGNLIGTDKVTIYIKNGSGNFEEVDSGRTFNELYDERKNPAHTWSKDAEEAESESDTIITENYKFVITYSKLIKYTNEDAADGFTPNTFSAEISITYTTNSADNPSYNKLIGAVTFGISIPSTDNGNIIESEEIFIYPAAVDSEISLSVSMSENHETKHVSGIKYISRYTANMSLSDISGTEQYITKSDERLKITVNNNFGNSNKIVKVSELTLEDGSNAKFDNRSSYFYNPTFTLNNTVGLIDGNKLTGTTITLYSQNGISVKSYTPSMVVPEDSKWFWTKNSSNNILTDNFTNEFNRILGTFNKNNSTVTEVGNGEWVSTQSLNGGVEAYQNALLVQDGKLMHPSKDATGTYSAVSDTRYYIKKITNEAGGSSNGFFITAKNAKFDDANCYIWLVNADASNPYKIRLNSRGNETEEGAAVETPNSNGMWECLIPSTEAGGCTINANTGFYIVIEMTKHAEPITGPLKITFK